MPRLLTLFLLSTLLLFAVQPVAGQYEKEAGRLLFKNAMSPAPAGPGKIAFLRIDNKIPDAPLELFVGEIKSLAETRALPGFDFQELPLPAFAYSPDGSEFVVPQKNAGCWELFRFKPGNRTGEKISNLVQFRETLSRQTMDGLKLTEDMMLSISEVAYSPSGKKLIFTLNRPGKNAIWWLDLQSGNTRQATEIQTGYYPSFAGDDDRFCYTTIIMKEGTNADEDILIRSIKTGVADTVVQSKAMEFSGVISPDGKFLAYVLTGAHNVNNIWVMNLATNQSRQQTTVPAGKNCTMPHWTADGRQIIFQGAGFGPQPAAFVRDFAPF